MKATGIVRNVDELGRIVIPKEIRRVMDIKEKDPLEIFVEDDKVILKKYQARNACPITGKVSDDNFVLAGGKVILSQEGAKILLGEIQKAFGKG